MKENFENINGSQNEENIFGQFNNKNEYLIKENIRADDLKKKSKKPVYIGEGVGLLNEKKGLKRILKMKLLKKYLNHI